MRRTQLVALMAMIAAVPMATASSFFGGHSASKDTPCFVAGNAGYRLSAANTANHVIRIDNAATHPALRMQLVDNAAQADFVLVDDGDDAGSCQSATRVESIRIDPAATRPELTVALSRQPADLKIYVKSSQFSDQDAAALFAVIWSKANATGSIAAR